MLFWLWLLLMWALCIQNRYSVMKTKEQLNAWLGGTHILTRKKGSKDCRLHDDSEPWITQDEMLPTAWGIFTGSDRRDAFSPPLTYGGNVLLRIMKEIVDHNLEINQDPLKILLYFRAYAPLTMLFLLLNKPSEVYLKPRDTAGLALSHLSRNSSHHFIVLSLPWFPQHLCSLPSYTLFYYYFSCALIMILHLHKHLFDIRTMSNVYMYFLFLAYWKYSCLLILELAFS